MTGHDTTHEHTHDHAKTFQPDHAEPTTDAAQSRAGAA